MLATLWSCQSKKMIESSCLNCHLNSAYLLPLFICLLAVVLLRQFVQQSLSSLLEGNKVFCNPLKWRLAKDVLQLLLTPKLSVKTVIPLPTSEHIVVFLEKVVTAFIFLTSWCHTYTQAVVLANTSPPQFAIYIKTTKEKSRASRFRHFTTQS